MTSNETVQYYIARYRQSDGTPQTLVAHIEGVAALAGNFTR